MHRKQVLAFFLAGTMALPWQSTAYAAQLTDVEPVEVETAQEEEKTPAAEKEVPAAETDTVSANAASEPAEDPAQETEQYTDLAISVKNTSGEDLIGNFVFTDGKGGTLFPEHTDGVYRFKTEEGITIHVSVSVPGYESDTKEVPMKEGTVSADFILQEATTPSEDPEKEPEEEEKETICTWNDTAPVKGSFFDKERSVQLDGKDIKVMVSGESYALTKDVQIPGVTVEEKDGVFTLTFHEGHFTFDVENASLSHSYNKDFTIDLTGPDSLSLLVGGKVVSTDKDHPTVLTSAAALTLTAFDEAFAESTITLSGASGKLKDAEKNTSWKEEDGKCTFETDMPDGEYALTLSVKDPAGHEAKTAEYFVIVDTKEPAITGTWSGASVHGSSFFNGARTLTLRTDVSKRRTETLYITLRGKEYAFDDLSALAGVKAVKSSAGEYVLTFGEGQTMDEDFMVSARVVDSEKQEASYKPDNLYDSVFTIDMTAPEAQVTVKSGAEEIPEGTSKEAPAYFGQEAVLSFHTKERNLEGGSVQIHVTKDGKDISEEVSAEDFTGLTAWVQGSKDSYSAPGEMTLSEDGTYEVTMEVTDAAGNTGYTKTQYFVIDTKVPELSMTVDNKKVPEVIDKETKARQFGIFANKDIKASLSASDNLAGLKAEKDEEGKVTSTGIFFTLYEGELDEEGNMIIPTDIRELEALTWTPYAEEITISPETKMVLLAKAVDKAGNTVYVASNEGIIAETKAPTASVSVQSAQAKTDEDLPLYDSSVSFTLHAKDEGDIASGLSRVSYQIVADGKEVTGKTFDKDLLDTFDKNETVTLDDHNHYSLIMTVVDKAGNESTVQKDFAVDTTAPEIHTSWEDSGAVNEKYYNKKRTLTIRVEDENFHEDGLSISVNGRKYSFAGVSSVTGIETKKVSEKEYILTFGADGKTDQEYDLSISAKDYVGHTSDKDESLFVIDEIAPETPQLIFNDGSRDVTVKTGGTPSYFNTNLSVRFSVKEHNFAEGRVEIIETKNESDHARREAEKTSSWSLLGDVASYGGYDFDDGRYSLKVRITDAAGNVSESPVYNFVRDTVAPDASVFVNGENHTASISGNKTYGTFTNTQANVTQTASDETSGIDKIQYHVYDLSSSDDPIEVPSLRTLEAMGWTDGEAVTISPDRQCIVYVRAIDRAGNATYISTRDGIIAERVNPNIDITLSDAPGRTSNGLPLYAGDAAFTVSADDNNGRVHSGIRSVVWNVTSGGTVVQRGEFSGLSGSRKQSASENLSVRAASANSNDVVITATVTDMAGNTQTIRKNLAIDTTAPKIEITFDRNDAKNGRYYEGTRTATITVTERNFDPSRVNLDITGTGMTMGDWKISSQEGSSDNAVHTRQIVFAQDGDYSIRGALTDRAGNKSNTAEAPLFTIDKTKPVITITYTGGKVHNGHYYNETRNAVIAVRERNFSPEKMTAAVKAALDGQGISAPGLSAWTGSGDLHTAVISFNKDGDFSFTVSGADLAENRAEEAQGESFTVDMTPPVLDVSGVEDGMSYNDIILTAFKYADRNLAKNERVLSWTLTGATRGQIYPAETTGNGTAALADIFHLKEYDDIYTLTAAVSDLAGNVTTKRMTFIVNRFGSVFTADEVLQAMMDKRFIQRASDITITETNPNELENMTVIIARDGTITTLTEKDIRIEHQTDENGWNLYTYRIPKKYFEQEGVYEIEITSTDAAGNKQSNKTKDSAFTFTVDRTAPSVVITGLTDGQKYEASKMDFGVKFADNLSVAEAHVLVNGKEVYTADADKLAKDGGVANLTMTEDPKRQVIEAYAVDAAGNKSETKRISVLVTTNRHALLVDERAVWGVGIAAITALSVSLFALFKYLKRKKDEDEDEEE